MTYRVTFRLANTPEYGKNRQRDIVCSDPRTARDVVNTENPGCTIVRVNKVKPRSIPREHLAEAAANW